MSIDVMKQALEALETCKVYDEADAWFDIDKVEEAADALRLAIEQAEKQEPVACAHEWFRTGAMQVGESRCIKCGEWRNTAPPQRQPLTDEEIAVIDDDKTIETMHDFARAIERAHGIGSNT